MKREISFESYSKINESESTEKVSKEWMQNVSNLIKKGKTLNDQSLSKMGRKEVILSYFPMADPNWRPKLSDVTKYLLVEENSKKIINQINDQLSEKDGESITSGIYSKYCGKFENWVKDIDLGYLNIKYRANLDSGRLTGFTDKSFSGRVSVSANANIPDGILSGANGRMSATGDFKLGYKGTVGKENIHLTFYPKSVNVSTSWIGAGKNLDFPGWVDAILGTLSLGSAYMFELAIKGNTLKERIRFFGKTWRETVIADLPLTSEIKKHVSDVKVSIPKDTLKLNSLPKSSKDFERLANQKAGGFKVKVNKS